MYVDTWSQKLKADEKCFGWGFAENGCSQSSHRTLKIDCISKMNRLNKDIFFHAGTNLGKLTVDSMILRWV